MFVITRKPDYRRLLTVLRREGEPDRIPFYEHFVDKEVVEAILGERLPPPTSRESEVRYLTALVKFYRKLGYDYVPFEIPLNLPRTNLLTAEDTAPLSRGMRVWQDENKGVIETMEDFEAYPWPDPEAAVDLTYFEILDRLLPEDMGIVGGVAGGVFEHVSWLMGLRPLCRAVYRDRRLVEKMFEKVGIPIIGVVENMAVYCCPNCGHTEHIFGAGGGEKICAQYGVPFLGSLPLNLSIREQADSGRPTVVADPDGAIATVYKTIARRVAITVAEKARDMTSKFPSIVVQNT